jgi:hypothetical protein
VKPQIKPAWTYRLGVRKTVTEASEEDLVAQAKVYLEKPLKE